MDDRPIAVYDANVLYLDVLRRANMTETAERLEEYRDQL